MLSLVAIAVIAQASPAEFYAHWADSRAELDGYRLTQPRYGEVRNGEAVMVWVIEPFSGQKRVKLDRPAEAGADLVQVMKLNLVRKFLTGIYDYALLTSVFSPLVFGSGPVSADQPLKISFGSQEWCGNVFHQLLRTPAGYRGSWFSYFESEGDGSEAFPLAEDLLTEDELWYRVRELTRPFPPATYQLLPSLSAVRLSHAPMVPGTVIVARSAALEPVVVPAGAFQTVRWTLRLAWGPQGTRRQTRRIWVEAAWPRRIVAWDGEVASFAGNEPTNERAELAGSIRDTYWVHNHLGDESLRRSLGLGGAPKRK